MKNLKVHLVLCFNDEMNADINEAILKPFFVTKAPKSVYYRTKFISECEESELVKRIYEAPKPKWTQLRNRRLQNYGGLPHPNGMVSEPLPQWLRPIVDKVSVYFPRDKQPNHVLVNEYEPQQGIMPHTDGPLFYPLIATVSLRSFVTLQILDSNLQRAVIGSILLEPQSLLLLTGDCYERFLHAIDECRSDRIRTELTNFDWLSNETKILDEIDRKTRISLTIRHVPKTLRFTLKSLKF